MKVADGKLSGVSLSVNGLKYTLISLIMAPNENYSFLGQDVDFATLTLFG